MSSSINSAITIIALLFLPYKAFSQINTWTVYSSFSTVNEIAISDNERFVASTGGVFLIRDQIIEETLTTVNGLHRLDPMSIHYDNFSDNVIIGYPDGIIDVLNSSTGDILSITDINRTSDFTSKQIHDIEQYNNQLYIATDFGIVVLDSQRFIVLNNYLKIGSFDRGIPIYDIEIVNDTLLVATSAGYGIADINANLLDPTSWQNYQPSENDNNRVDKIAAITSNYLSIANGSLLRFNGGIWENITITGISNPVDLSASEKRIAIADANSVSVMDATGNSSEIYLTDGIQIRNITLFGDMLFIGTVSNGVVEVNLNSGQEISYLPDGPYLNFFSELDFSNNSLLSTATDEFPQSDPFNSIRGYYIYKDQKWENYNRNTSSVLKDYSFSTAYSALNSELFYAVGSWGDGLVLHDKETNEIRVFDRSNSGFSGISANRDYIVISGLDEDSKNNIWAISYISDLPLNFYSPLTDSWSHFPSVPVNSDELYFRLFIDSNDHLWIPLIDVGNNGQGLLVLDPGNDLTSDNDDTYRKLTSDENSGNLPDDNVTAIVEDKNGEVWIGTTRGIARFIFPDFIVSSNNPSEYRAQWLINSDTAATSRFLLRDVNVTSIAVNSANQKWIGSASQGAWLINEDGSSILKRLTKNNSPLLSDNIQDITIDEKTGEVFFSTDLGLISLVDVAKESVASMSELKVYPNPFVYERHTQITIENLSDQTTVRILGADGSVFNELESRGGRITWDGKSSNGEMLSSGVYFIIALDKNKNDKGIGKVVIIR